MNCGGKVEQIRVEHPVLEPSIILCITGTSSKMLGYLRPNVL